MAQINYKLVYCWAFLFSLAIALSGCVPEAEKSEGYKLYSAKCSSCHRLLPPENYTLEKLEEYIVKYGKEMTAEEKSKLFGFLKEYKDAQVKERER